MCLLLLGPTCYDFLQTNLFLRKLNRIIPAHLPYLAHMEANSYCTRQRKVNKTTTSIKHYKQIMSQVYRTEVFI